MPVTPLYIASSDSIIRAVNASGVISTPIFTSTDAVYIANGGFIGIVGLAADSTGNIYVCDQYAGAIYKINSGGVVTHIAGTIAGQGFSLYANGSLATSVQLSSPYSIAVDAAGNVYFWDSEFFVISAINTQATTQTILGVSIAAGCVKVVAGTNVSGFFGDGGAAISAKINDGSGVALDSAGNLYIADTNGGNSSTIRKVTTAGIISTVAGIGGESGYTGDGGVATNAKLNSPEGVTLDSAGNIYITDSDNLRIRAVNTQATTQTLLGVSIAAGNIQTVVGTGTNGFSGDNGAATSAKISSATFSKFDASGSLYICDALSNFRVREVTSAGVISTIAGNGSSGNTGDGGAATSAEIGPNVYSLTFPAGPAVVTITALLEDPSSTPLLSTSQAWVRFRLRGYTGSTPAAGAAAVLCETQIDSFPNGSGEISQILWPNSFILPAGTWYTVEYFNENRITSSANYFLNASGDLSSQTQINPPPVPPPL